MRPWRRSLVYRGGAPDLRQTRIKIIDSTFGNANQLGGVSQSTETIEKATWILACVISVLSLITAVNFGDSNTIESTSIENVAPTQQNPVNNPFPANPSSEK